VKLAVFSKIYFAATSALFAPLAQLTAREPNKRRYSSMDLQAHWNTAYGAIIAHGPSILAAVAIIVAAYIIGKLLSSAVKYIINRTSLGRQSKDTGQDLGDAIGTAVFWVTMLIAIPAALGALGLDGLLRPMQAMAEKLLAFIPNFVGAGLILGLGWIIATVAQRAVTSTLRAAQADRFAERFGLAEVTGETGITKFAGVLVFTLLIIPIAIAALDALDMRSISGPAQHMLTSFLNAIPNVFAAAIVILLAFIIGRFASATLTSLLPATGFDKVGDRVGLTQEVFAGTPLSKVAGHVAFFAIMIFGLIEGAKLLNFGVVSDMLSTILGLGGQILLGSVIIAFGVVAADFIAGIVEKSKDAKPVAGFLRVAIIILAVAMGLRQMGIANEIITLGFGLFLGALALGAAIAIGWGGKETAGRLLEKWTKNM
jgi:Mechanosensitive ion channel, conserved TM helix